MLELQIKLGMRKYMYCTNCGHKNKDGDLFCRNCGTRLEEPINIPSDNSSQDSIGPTQSSSDTPTQSFINQPTELIDPNTSDSISVHQTNCEPEVPPEKSSINDFGSSNPEPSSFQDFSSTFGSHQPSQPFLEPDQSVPLLGTEKVKAPLVQNEPKKSKGKKIVGILIGCIVLGLVFGGGTYLFLNRENIPDIPFISSFFESEESSEEEKIKIAREGEESIAEEGGESLENNLAAPSKDDSALRISVFSSPDSEASKEEKIAKESSEKAAAPTEPIKVQNQDPYVGKYRTNYVMRVRAQPNYDGEKIGRKEKDVLFEVVKSEAGPNSSIWGQLPDGGWICLKDADLVYATEVQ